MPVLLVFADNDSISQKHVAQFFALLGGGVKEPGWQNTQLSKARLAIVPGYSHYNFITSPEAPQIRGYVHFSDLNNSLVKLAFYAIFEAFERHLLSELGPFSEEELAEVLGPVRLKRIRKEMRRAKKNEANLSWESFLFLPEILRLGWHRGKVMLKDEEINTVKAFRNRVSHAGWTLVEDRNDLGRLVEVKRICLALLTGTAGGK
jgi:hypothetical protein